MIAYIIFGTFFLAVLFYVVKNFMRGMKKDGTGGCAGCPMGCSGCSCGSSSIIIEEPGDMKNDNQDLTTGENKS